MQLRLDPEHRLLAGVLGAAITGLVLGAAMHPDLQGSVDNEGPRMLIAGGASRSDGPFGAETGWSSYAGRVPDYVVGTDWLRAQAAPEMTVAVAADPAPALPVDLQDTTQQRPVVYAPPVEHDSEQPTRPLYPSIDGNRAYPSDAYPSDGGELTSESVVDTPSS